MEEKVAETCCKKGNWTYVGWIPVNKAKIGSIIELVFNRTIEDGWKVISVGQLKLKNEVGI